MLNAGDREVLAMPAIDAVEAMSRAVLAHGRGELGAPVRVTIDVSDGDAAAAGFTLTAGRLPGVANGFRVGSFVPETAGEVTLVFRPGPQPLGAVTGRNLGRRRTGALGGVAARLCSREDSAVIGLIGAGEQAFTQLWAIAAVRPIRLARVFSRNAATAKAFSDRVEHELGLAVEAVENAQFAVTGCDIVVMSTPALAPMLELGWIDPGTHIHTLGPKGSTLDPLGAAEGECPRALVRAADLFVSDSPAQLLAMEGAEQPWTQGRKAVSLGELAVGAQPGRTSSQDITCYASVGLAGTEVLLAHQLFESLTA